MKEEFINELKGGLPASQCFGKFLQFCERQAELIERFAFNQQDREKYFKAAVRDAKVRITKGLTLE